MPTKELIMGNHATSHGVRLARAEVIAAYPITPQTQVVEELSEMCAKGELKAHFIKVESEHSAMACCIGAAQAGARTFTATSSHGLALMHEMLFWAAYGRLPVVLCNVNRAMGPGWNIWSDQTDSLAQRDTGWVQIYCETNQEVLDTVLIAFKLAEKIDLPVMIVYDAFILSHTYEPVEIPDQKDVDKFLPPRKAEYKLDTSDPKTFNPLTTPDHFTEFRHRMEMAHRGTFEAYESVASDFSGRFGRQYDIIEMIDAEGADTILLSSGSTTSTARVAIEELRKKGQRVGICKMRMFRPFPTSELCAALAKQNQQTPIKKIAVLDRNISHGVGGIWAQEVKAALYSSNLHPAIFDFHLGLGGRNITPETIIKACEYTRNHESQENPTWIDLKNDQ